MAKKLDIFSDEELAAMAAGGDSEAEEFLIRKYVGEVRGKAHLYFIMGGDSEDIVQEGMIGIFNAIRRFDPSRGVPFKPYMETCISNRIFTALESAGRQKHAPLNESISMSSEEYESCHGSESISEEPESSPEDLVVFKDFVESLSKNEGKLFSPLEEKVWKLYYTGYIYLEISKLLGKSPKSVDNAIQRIKKKITTYLNY